jgi:hypothetical protein
MAAGFGADWMRGGVRETEERTDRDIFEQKTQSRRNPTGVEQHGGIVAICQLSLALVQIFAIFFLLLADHVIIQLSQRLSFQKLEIGAESIN